MHNDRLSNRAALLGKVRGDWLPTAAILFSMGVFGGCLMDPSASGTGVSTAAADQSAQSQSLRNQPLGNPDVPAGCSRVWSDAAADSVLSCPDIRPSKPH